MSGEKMEFPRTLDEFMEQYKIVDTEQVYTNGTELVPIFRIKQWEDAHEPKKGKKFIEIVTEYPDPAICAYPEYKGKPYFSIRYDENGEKIEGFGTYKPEVLSEYIREYFIGANVTERKAKWELFIQCSACGYKRKWNGEIFDFCPNCGAEMRGEKADE